MFGEVVGRGGDGRVTDDFEGFAVSCCSVDVFLLAFLVEGCRCSDCLGGKSGRLNGRVPRMCNHDVVDGLSFCAEAGETDFEDH